MIAKRPLLSNLRFDHNCAKSNKINGGKVAYRRRRSASHFMRREADLRTIGCVSHRLCALIVQVTPASAFI